jgi:hypothetical protein
MANTTNFNWETPDDTDLVKDGAAAMRTLGNSIDTSFVDLKGGTTGQILSKASNTDLDYTWVTTDDANAIQNAIVDAKGDLIAASANDTPARLAVGNNGETLVADSSTATGLRYTAGNPIPNPILNSCFDIWQRGTSGTANSYAAGAGYNTDRWNNFANGTSITVSRQATGDTTNLPNVQYCARVQRNSGQTSLSVVYHTYNQETVNSIPLAGKTVTVSFYARAGANFSAASSALSLLFATGTGTDQTILNGYTGQATVSSASYTLTTTWQRFTVTGTLATSATQYGLSFNYTPVGTASTNDYFEVTGVQIDLGSVALPVRRNGATIQGELAACQRYYFRNTGALIYLGSGGIAGSTTQCYVQVKHPTTMRIPPTTIDNSLLLLQIISGSTNVTSTTISKAAEDITLVLANTASGLTATTQSYMLMTQNNAAAYLGLSAEL